jgi:hypothetical protein
MKTLACGEIVDGCARRRDGLTAWPQRGSDQTRGCRRPFPIAGIAPPPGRMAKRSWGYRIGGPDDRSRGPYAGLAF